MMISLHSFGFFGAIFCFTPAVTALTDGGHYIGSISDTGKLTVTFYIDRSQYSDTQCVEAYDGKPFFRSSSDGVVPYAIRCTVQDNITTAGNCNFPSGTSGCHCTDQTNNSYYVIEYNVDSGYEMYWEASVNCADATFQRVLEFTDIDCKPVPPPTTTATTSTTESTTTETTEQTTRERDHNTSLTTMSTSSSSTQHTTTTSTQHTTTTEGGASHKYVAIGVGVGFAVLAVIIAIVTFLVLRYRAKTQKQKLNNGRHTNGVSNPQDRTSHQLNTEM